MSPEKVETIMTVVCDLCHFPYVETDQEELDLRCESCPVERALKELR